eukprot:scaffold7340_cov266-Pinguiococcus_pyrenoidosus.AAC.15
MSKDPRGPNNAPWRQQRASPCATSSARFSVQASMLLFLDECGVCKPKNAAKRREAPTTALSPRIWGRGASPPSSLSFIL